MPVAQRPAGSSIAVFSATRDGLTACRVLRAGDGQTTWTDWENVGPALGGRPVLCENIDGRLELFGRGLDGRLGHNWQTHDERVREWTEWESFAPAIVGDPAVARNGAGRLEVFALDDSGAIGHAWQRVTGNWSGWHPLAADMAAPPTVIANANGLLIVLVVDRRGTLGVVQQVQVGPSELSWDRWRALDAPFAGAVAAVHNLDGHIDVIARDPAGRLGNMWQNGRNAVHGWSRWHELGAQLDGAPTVAANADGRVEVFGRGVDGRLGHLYQPVPNGAEGWSGWESFGPEIAADPAVVLNASGELDVYAVAVDGRLGHVAQESRDGVVVGWREWEDLGPVAHGSVPAVAVINAVRTGSDSVMAAASGRPGRSASRVTADVCVVGAGPAGVALSEVLIAAGQRVVMIESGGVHPDPNAQRLNRGAAHGPIIKGYWRYLMDGRRRMVGGSASIWGAGICMPFTPIDFAARPWVDATGWPIAHRELAPFEREAAAFFGFAPFGPPEPDGALVRLRYRHPPDPQPWLGVFDRLVEGASFRAELGCTALELAVSGDRIQSLRCGLFDGSALDVSADRFVLAAGGIENPRLLLLNEHSLPPLSPLTGRCFMEHPHLRAAQITLPNVPDVARMLPGEAEREVFALPDAEQQELALLLASVEVRAPRKLRDPGEPVECDLYVRAEQAPNPQSAVTLGTSQRDLFGQRPVMLNWRLLPIDWHSVVSTTQRVAAELERRYDTQARLLVEDNIPWPGVPAAPTDPADSTWGNHHMGTTRMADDPQDGVVDRNCRVHGTENLYLAGSSVFPTGSCANPTFTIVTLARRLGAHLTGAAESIAAASTAG